ncbi:SRRT [Cordylochernes scorpioides]|uniref:SRRT n=1 Tax=Cordylochernes scorpioides TaxID=51811 RepID=A0ABY6KBZ3_9ARAC|nr:SRRT [Cordylochernes scorpioides]
MALLNEDLLKSREIEILVGDKKEKEENFFLKDEPSGMTQPPMMTFKQFLNSQDDTIDDQEAVKKYGEYKLEFKKQQISEFFLSHKEEEW